VKTEIVQNYIGDVSQNYIVVKAVHGAIGN